jgi:hypothetical protein
MQRNQEREGGGANIDVVVTRVHNAYDMSLFEKNGSSK